MKKKLLVCFLLALSALLAVVLVNKINSKNIKSVDEEFSYKLEYVKSLNDIDKSLPTVIFFKGLINEDVSLEYERMLKDLKDELNFNLVHISLDYVTTAEQKDIITKYNVTEVPMIVVRDVNGNDVEILSNTTYEKIKELVSKLS